MSALKVLYIGGTGTISAACVAESVAAGHEVHVLNRGVSTDRPTPEGVVEHVGDAHDAAGLRELAEAERFDSIAQFVAFGPEHVAADVAALTGLTRQYLFISSASAYQTPPTSLPVTESTPLRNPFWEYSRKKIACEDVLVAAHRADGFPSTIVRPSHTYDRTKLPVEGRWGVIKRMREGRPVVVHGDGTSLWTITHAEDFARGFVALLGRPEAIGEAFHITGDEAPTWNRIYSELARAAGVDEPEFVHVPSDAIAAVDPEWGSALLGDKAHSMVFDNAKLRRLAPDFRARIPFARGAEEIVAWFDAHPGAQVVDERLDALMDRLVEVYRPRALGA